MSRFIGGFAGQKAAISFIAARKKALAAEARAVCNPARAAARAYRDRAKAADLKQFNDYYAYGDDYDAALHAALADLGVPADIIRGTSSGKTRASMGMLNEERKRPERARGRRVVAPAAIPPATVAEIIAEIQASAAQEPRLAPQPILNEDLDAMLDFSIPKKDLPLVMAIIDAHPEILPAARADNIAYSAQIGVEELMALEAAVDPVIADKLADLVLPPTRAAKVKTAPKRAVKTAPARDVPAAQVQMAERPLVLTPQQEMMLPRTADKLAALRYHNPELLEGTPFEARQGDWPYYQFRTDPSSDIAPRDLARGRIQRGLKGRHLEHTPLEFWIDEWANITNQAEAVDDILAWGLDYILNPKLVATKAGRNIPSLADVFPAERKRMLEDLSFAWNGLLMLFHTRLGVKQTDKATARYLKTAVPGKGEANIVTIPPVAVAKVVETIAKNPNIISNADLESLLNSGEIPVAAVVALAAAAHDPRYDMDKNNLLRSDIEYIASTLTEQLFDTNIGLSKKNTADFEKVLNNVTGTLSIALSSGEEVSDASRTAMAQGQATYDAIKKLLPSKRAAARDEPLPVATWAPPMPTWAPIPPAASRLAQTLVATYLKGIEEDKPITPIELERLLTNVGRSITNLMQEGFQEDGITKTEMRYMPTAYTTATKRVARKLAAPEDVVVIPPAALPTVLEALAKHPELTVQDADLESLLNFGEIPVATVVALAAAEEERKDPAPVQSDIKQTARELAETVLGFVGDKTRLSKDQKATYTKTFNGIKDTLEETTSPDFPNGNLDLAMSRAMDIEERKNTPKNAIRTFVFDSSGKPLTRPTPQARVPAIQLDEAKIKVELGAEIMQYLRTNKDGTVHKGDQKLFVDVYKSVLPSVRGALLKGMSMTNAIRNADVGSQLSLYRK
jgi:hypothetical protein